DDADRRRFGRPCGCVRGGGPLRSADAAIPTELRVHRDHRRFSRPPASARHDPRRPLARRDLCRRRDRANRYRPAPGGHRPVPGGPAVLPARRRCAHPLPHRLTPPSRRRSAFMTTSIAISILMTVVIAATPILIAALGELVAEKSGVLNLGVEGMMLIGAVA